jgi:hypothetical protein
MYYEVMKRGGVDDGSSKESCMVFSSVLNINLKDPEVKGTLQAMSTQRQTAENGDMTTEMTLSILTGNYTHVIMIGDRENHHFI